MTMKDEIKKAIREFERENHNAIVVKNAIREKVSREYRKKDDEFVSNTFNTQYWNYMSANRGSHNFPPPRPELVSPIFPFDKVGSYIKYWETHEDMHHYRIQERLIECLFKPDNPTPNVDLNLVLQKVCILDTFYSTNLTMAGLDALVQMAEWIIRKIDKFDARLKAGDTGLVNEIVQGGEKNCFSFATKYCFHHYREGFHIYDSKVVSVLRHFKDEFFDGRPLSTEQLAKDGYEFYHCGYEKFKAHHEKLRRLDNWRLDKYLWLLGDELSSKIQVITE